MKRKSVFQAIQNIALVAIVIAALVLVGCSGKNNSSGSSRSNSTNPSASQGSSNTPAANEWPNNKYTQQVPKPADRIKSTDTMRDRYLFVFSNATESSMKTYVEQLKSAGFTQYVSESTDSGGNLKFEAWNAANWRVMIYNSNTEWVLEIIEPNN